MTQSQLTNSVKSDLSDLRQELQEGERGWRPNYNIFFRPFDNMIFWIILLVQMNVQYMWIGYDSICPVLSTYPLRTGMHITAIFLGLGSWALAAIMKKYTGNKFLSYMPVLDETQEAIEK